MKIYEIGLKQAADLLSSNKISSFELVSGLLDRINKTEPKLHALNYIDEENALKEAKLSDSRRLKGSSKSIFDGIPAIIKDNICVKGMPATCSSKMLSNFVPEYDAHVIERFRAQGIIPLAKSNLDEFAMGTSTEYSYFGPSFNPWDISRVPGGSSGGSAAAVSAGLAPLALGTDTGGSIRQPASFCGVVGLKPTYGAISRYGAAAFASSLDQIGPITRSVEDAAFALNTVCGYDNRDSTSININHTDYSQCLSGGIKGLKIGLPKEFFISELSPDIKSAFDNCVNILEGLGACVKTASLPTFEYALAVYHIISCAEAASNLSRFDGIKFGYRAKDYDDLYDLYVKTRSEGFGDEVKRRIMLGNYVLSSGYYDEYYLKALKVRTLIKRDFDSLFEKYDLLISPTTPVAAFKAGEMRDDASTCATDIYTMPVNIAGISAITIPCGLTKDGLPAGFQIIAKPFDEARLLRAAYSLERALPPIGKPVIAKGLK